MFSGVFLHIILGSIGNHSYMQRQTGAAWGQVCAEITTLGIEWAIVDNCVKTSMKLTRLHSIIKWLRSLSIGLLTVCVLWLSAWACERARVRQKSGWKSKTCLHMLDIIRQLLALCLFVRSLPPPPNTSNYMAHKLAHWSPHVFSRWGASIFAPSSCISGHLRWQLRKKWSPAGPHPPPSPSTFA